MLINVTKYWNIPFLFCYNTCVCVHAHKLSSGVFMHAQNIGQLAGADYLLILCGSLGLNSGH